MIYNNKILEEISTPPLIIEQELFLMKFAENEEEIRAAMSLRYEVFNIEQGKGLESAEHDEIDCDEFDEFCLHLIIVEKKTSRIVGTYRVNPGPVARTKLGFYAAREYNIVGLNELQDEILEVGRSCVHPEYRSGAVIGLLWSGISGTLVRAGLHYTLGCVSLDATDPNVGWALYEHFKLRDKLSDQLKATPGAGFELPPANQEKVDELLENKVALLKHIPSLFKGYLRLGVKICGVPIWDKEFGTIDFLILLNYQTMPEKYLKHFFKEFL
ncbi:MAG: GNAT family N-acetyltransferase [Victivallales bacterium]|nr:GNAT family N-acetyltransferase [Victivallales bacterium]